MMALTLLHRHYWYCCCCCLIFARTKSLMADAVIVDDYESDDVDAFVSKKKRWMTVAFALCSM